jgi:hypothetical protein
LNSEPIARSQSNGSRPIRVLMADPDESLQPLYREPLLREGFEPVTAASGLECVARLRECVPDGRLFVERVATGMWKSLG